MEDAVVELGSTSLGSSTVRREFASVTSRFIAWTLLACGGVYLATVVVSNAMARRLALGTAEREAVSRAEAAARRVEGVLGSIEARTRLLGDVVASMAPGAADDLLRRVVAESPELHGVALIPETGDALDTRAPAAPSRHREQPVYAATRAAGEPRWSEPYQGQEGEWLVTFAAPAQDQRGARVGVVAADVSLAWLDDVAASLTGDEKGFGVILSRSGRLLAYPRREAAGASRPLLEDLPPDRRAHLAPIVARMLSGETGFLPVEAQGQRYRMTYQPLGRAGWSLGVLYPEDELLAGVRRLRLIQASLGVTGLALLAAVVVVVSRRITGPVKALAASAERIASGDLDAELPPIESRDEVGGLARAFHHMRDSLKTQIRDLRETTAAKERLESELRVARRIQTAMLPPPRAGGPGQGYELAATLVPARAVGGDLFDHFRVGARVFFMVGDVSGKGVGAALFMARAKMLFETVAARESDPGAILTELNRGLSAENETNMYLTAVLGALDVESGELSLAVAGHEPPVLVPIEGAPRTLQTEGGPVIGLLADAAYPLNRLRLGPREAVVLFTDGVSEARDSADDFFEVERLIATLEPLGHEPVGAVTDGILAAVRSFAGEAPQSDDITILTLRYLALA